MTMMARAIVIYYSSDLPVTVEFIMEIREAVRKVTSELRPGRNSPPHGPQPDSERYRAHLMRESRGG